MMVAYAADIREPNTDKGVRTRNILDHTIAHFAPSKSSRMSVRASRPLAAACLCLVLIEAVFTLGEHKLHRDSVNAFKMFDLFPDGVAVFTSSHNPSLECVTATRMLYQPNKRVAYTWSLNGGEGTEKKTYLLEYLPGSRPDTVIAVANRDTKHPLQVKFEYTNNKNCVVANFPYNNGEVCILWVRSDAISDVPHECIDQYEDICDDEVPAYREDKCKNDSGAN